MHPETKSPIVGITYFTLEGDKVISKENIGSAENEADFANGKAFATVEEAISSQKPAKKAKKAKK